MQHITSESERNKRIAFAAYLRSNDDRNRERLASIHGILSGSSYPSKEPVLEPAYPLSSDKEESAFWHSFRIRAAVSLLMTIAICLGIMSGSPKLSPYIETMKTVIKTDYSENLFDFIERIPYTLEYEKINAKG